MGEGRPLRVEVYGVDHSPWVQAVLLGLHDAGIDHTLTSTPPLECFLRSGVTMPAASIDGGPWLLESADILSDIGYSLVSREERKLVEQAWRGVLHRTDSAALFFGGFSLIRDGARSLPGRLAQGFARSFIAFYMYVLIRSLVLLNRPREPENHGDQFMPFEDRLATSGGRFLGGTQPDTLDFLLFGIVQCHASIYVPPITALQSDPRLVRLRDWIGAMHARLKDYGHLYSGVYLAPFGPPPARAATSERMAFWSGVALMIGLFPVTLPLVAILAIRKRKGGT
jgi:hypothetical protein